MNFEKTTYGVWRSIDKGEFWAELTYKMELNFKDAKKIFEQEKKEHPSDYICIVKTETPIIRLYKGNKRSKNNGRINRLQGEVHRNPYGNTAQRG